MASFESNEYVIIARSPSPSSLLHACKIRAIDAEHAMERYAEKFPHDELLGISELRVNQSLVIRKVIPPNTQKFTYGEIVREL